MRTPDYDALPYRLLIIDDQKGKSSWGNITRIALTDAGFLADHATSWDEAKTKFEVTGYDIFVIDLDLQAQDNGLEVLQVVRKIGIHQPVILASGNTTYLDKPVRDYTHALALGPVYFLNKNGDVNLMELVVDASNHVDPLQRSLRIMREAGLGTDTFVVDGAEMSVDELLKPGAPSVSLTRALRESLNVLLLRITKEKERA